MQPLLDTDGNILAEDHPKIKGDHRIIRRISKHHIVNDEKTQRRRISTMAYEGRAVVGQGMSVDIEELLVAKNVNPQQFVTTPIFTGSVVLKVDDIRMLDFRIGYVPIKDDPRVPDNPYHGEVWGAFSKGKQKAIARLAEWFVKIDDVDLTG